MSNDEKSASQFISALIKNLQAVCHGHVEFDKNVKVVGHLYLTVDSGSEFNYIVNEKVSKSDESSTTFISKSFYATDPLQKISPKKAAHPTPNVLNTTCDVSIDLTDEPVPRLQPKTQFSRPHFSKIGLPYLPQRRRPTDSRLYSHHMTKTPRLSSPTVASPRKSSTSLSHRSTAPSTLTSITPVFISPESVSATSAHSLPGADRPEDFSDKTNQLDIKFEVIKVEKGGSDDSNNKTTTDDEEEFKIKSDSDSSLVTSIDLVSGQMTNSELCDSVKPSYMTSTKTECANNKDEISSELVNPTLSFQLLEPETPEKADIIEIDLTTVKDELDGVLDTQASYLYANTQRQRYSSGGEISLSGFEMESHDDDFLNSLRDHTVGLYPVGVHANESNSANPDGPDASYIPVPGTSSSPSTNNSQAKNAEKCRKYRVRKKLLNYTDYIAKERERGRMKRFNRTEEQLIKDREAARLRMRKYREKKKAKINQNQFLKENQIKSESNGVEINRSTGTGAIKEEPIELTF